MYKASRAFELKDSVSPAIIHSTTNPQKNQDEKEFLKKVQETGDRSSTGGTRDTARAFSDSVR
ncbi:hypothetical protein PC116_g32065 [Phytophthora cactorum]|nr:hypothetical protein PC116_g32065 [Phytophthora cactorum]